VAKFFTSEKKFSAAYKAAVETIHNSINKNAKFQTNPITGGGWVLGVDPIHDQVLQGMRALIGKQVFEPDLPNECKVLPLSRFDREQIKWETPHSYLVSSFASSLHSCDYNLKHPIFPEYASAACRSPYAPDLILNLRLQSRYATQTDIKLGPGLCWIRPK